MAPLVAKLEGTLARARGDAFEAMYNIEEELGERLVEAGREAIGSALATALVENSFEELDVVLRDLVDPKPIKTKLQTYFDSFATADFFQELHELQLDAQNSGEFRDLFVHWRATVQSGMPIHFFIFH